MPFYGYNVVAEAVSNVTLTNSVELGTRRTTGGIDYVYIYNGSNSQISQGQMGNIGAASMNSGYTVTVTNAASQVGGELVVGVAHNATITTGAYGWLATRGFVYAALDASAISANSGDFVGVGIDGGFVSCVVSAQTGIRLGEKLGVALNSLVTTVGTGKIAFKSKLFS